MRLLGRSHFFAEQSYIDPGRSLNTSGYGGKRVSRQAPRWNQRGVTFKELI